jgi:hypothetical protein
MHLTTVTSTSPSATSANKQAMVEWLQMNGFSAKMVMRITILFDNTGLQKPREKVYKVD